MTLTEVFFIFILVTEREIQKGILRAKDLTEHTLAYVRKISNVNITLLRFAAKFVDIAGRAQDSEAAKLLATLSDEKVSKVLPESNIRRFNVEWEGKDGITEDTHKDYLTEFCNDFYGSIVGLVDRAVEKDQKMTSDSTYGEILQHLHACSNHVKVFQGREEIIARFKAYVNGDTGRPLVIHGESGCGKTSLTAKGYSTVSMVPIVWTNTPKK